ncbi:MAG TPA: hypothetical protein VG245_00920 [Candidatus Dormibacteraeota bacterium]|nr:hypothetical protein [Candidatus Dormibacteraeota bacterium]
MNASEKPGAPRPHLNIAGGEAEISASDVEICTEVLTRLLSSESNRVAWLMGFLVGSQLGVDATGLA